MLPVSPVIASLDPYEVKIGGPENGQPEYVTLPALSSPDGKVMSRWHLSDEERTAIANGADICVTLHGLVSGNYPPTQVHVQDPNTGADYFRETMHLDDALALRMMGDDVRAAQKAFEERQQVLAAKAKEVCEKLHGPHGDQAARG